MPPVGATVDEDLRVAFCADEPTEVGCDEPDGGTRDSCCDIDLALGEKFLGLDGNDFPVLAAVTDTIYGFCFPMPSDMVLSTDAS